MPFTSVADEMSRFKRGELHSGKNGPVVTSKAQAVAIALSEERAAKRKKRHKKAQQSALSSMK